MLEWHEFIPIDQVQYTNLSFEILILHENNLKRSKIHDSYRIGELSEIVHFLRVMCLHTNFVNIQINFV